MKKLLIGLAVLGVMFLGIVAVAPFFIPIDQYRAELIERVKAATGRDLTIAGDVYFAAFPHLALEAEGVTLSNPPGMASPDLMRADRLEVRLKVLPLLLGRIEIRRFLLIQPVIALETAPDGTHNWIFSPTPDQSIGPAPPLPGTPATPVSGTSASAPGTMMTAAEIAAGEEAIQTLHMEDMRLVDGTVTYIDRRNIEPLMTFTHIRMSLSLAGLHKPFTGQGVATWHQRDVNLSATVVDPAALLQGEDSGLSLQVSTKLLRFDFKGDLSRASPLMASGYVDIRMPSLRDWSDWMGTSWRLPGTGPGAVVLTGNIDAQSGKTKVTNAALSLDDIRATGQFSVDMNGPRPLVQGLIDMDRVDLDSYMPGPPERAGGIEAGLDMAMQPDMPWGTLPPAGSGPVVKGKPAPTPGNWDDQPIDWSALHYADADLSLSAGQIYLRGLRLGRSVLDLHLHDRRLTVDLTRFALYDGFGNGSVTITDDGAKPAYQARFNLTDIQMAPMLKDLAGFDKLTGIGTIDINLTTAGRSNRDIVANLAGSGSIGLNDGGLRGLNLNAILRAPAGATGSLGHLGDVTMAPSASASFILADGVAKTRDMTLRMPAMTVTGGGSISLPKRELSIRLIPHDQPGTGLNAVEIAGPWGNLAYRTASATLPGGGRSVHRASRPSSSSGPLHFLRRLFGGD